MKIILIRNGVRVEEREKIMLETCLIVFREGLEAFLIVAIMLAYVTKTGRAELRQPIFWGIAVAMVISATTGWHVADLAKNPVWEASLAIIAGALVASFTLYIMRTAKTIRHDIHARMEQNAHKGGLMAMIGIFLFTILMISREGMETALMLGAMTAQHETSSMWMGAALAAILVSVVSYLWSVQSQKINLRLFLQVTGIFLVLFSIYLFIYGLHELAELGYIPFMGGEEEHEEPSMLGEIFKHVATYGLAVIPCAWLGYSYLRDRLAARDVSAAE